MRKSRYIAIALTAIAASAEAGAKIEVDGRADRINEYVQKVKEYDNRRSISNHFDSYVKGIVIQKAEISVDVLIATAGRGDQTNITEVGGCYTNCYGNCHGSRSWR